MISRTWASAPRPPAGMHSGSVLQMRLAQPLDADVLLALREAAGRRLVTRGIRQWEPGEVSVEQIRAQVGAGEWWVHGRDGAVAGALRLLWSDVEFWGDRPDDDAYVHGLMIDRCHAGEGLGRRLLDWAEHRAREADRPFLRLDCAEVNDRLRRYYRERGFREVGRRDFDGTWWSVTLFEKPLAA
jgi:ribosomal protein S18 acetylase RimI-like enzyme